MLHNALSPRALPILLFLLVLPMQASSQPDSLSRAERLDTLRNHVIPVRTVDPAHTDFSDLHPLKDLIGERRIVILGEPTHGDGTGLPSGGSAACGTLRLSTTALNRRCAGLWRIRSTAPTPRLTSSRWAIT